MKYLVFFMLLLTASVATAQPDKRSNGQKMRQAKIAYITGQVELSPEQAKHFWPLYDQYDARRSGLRREVRKLNREPQVKGLSEEAAQAHLRKLSDLRQQEVDLEKTYQGRFLEVVSARQLAALHVAEQRFTQLLIEKLHRPENTARQ